MNVGVEKACTLASEIDQRNCKSKEAGESPPILCPIKKNALEKASSESHGPGRQRPGKAFTRYEDLSSLSTQTKIHEGWCAFAILPLGGQEIGRFLGLPTHASLAYEASIPLRDLVSKHNEQCLRNDFQG